MKLDFESIWIWIKTNKRILLIILGLIVLLGVMSQIFSSCDNWFERRTLDGLNKNINKANAELKNLNQNLRELEINNRLQSENVNRLTVNHNEAKNGSNEAQRETNDALENVREVEKGNFTNSTLENANRARCLAFPKSNGCP